MKTYYVCSVYTQRSYGGHEEGGWWFNTEVPLLPQFEHLHSEPFTSHVWSFRTEKKARAFMSRLQRKLDYFINSHRRPMDSIACEGHIDACIYDRFPYPQPEKAPCYE